MVTSIYIPLVTVLAAVKMEALETRVKRSSGSSRGQTVDLTIAA